LIPKKLNNYGCNFHLISCRGSKNKYAAKKLDTNWTEEKQIGEDLKKNQGRVTTFQGIFKFEGGCSLRRTFSQH